MGEEGEKETGPVKAPTDSAKGGAVVVLVSLALCLAYVDLLTSALGCGPGANGPDAGVADASPQQQPADASAFPPADASAFHPDASVFPDAGFFPDAGPNSFPDAGFFPDAGPKIFPDAGPNSFPDASVSRFPDASVQSFPDASVVGR